MDVSCSQADFGIPVERNFGTSLELPMGKDPQMDVVV